MIITITFDGKYCEIRFWDLISEFMTKQRNIGKYRRIKEFSSPELVDQGNQKDHADTRIFHDNSNVLVSIRILQIIIDKRTC